MSSMESLDTIMPRVMEELGGSDYTTAMGTTALVGIVDDAPVPYVVKVVQHRDLLQPWRLTREEYAALSYLTATSDSPLELPRPVILNKEPPYACYTKLSGVPLTVTLHQQAAEMAAFSPGHQRQIGEDLADFMAWQQRVLTPSVFLERICTDQDSLYPKLDFDTFYQANLADFSHPAYPTLTAKATQYWGLYQHYYPNGSYRSGDRVNHFDLRGQNMMQQNGKLAGVLDWQGVEIGNINQELRGAYRMGPVVFEATLARLALHDIAVDPAHVRFWSRTRSIGVLCYWAARNEVHNPLFQESASLIRADLPDEDWTELDPPEEG